MIRKSRFTVDDLPVHVSRDNQIVITRNTENTRNFRQEVSNLHPCSDGLLVGVIGSRVNKSTVTAKTFSFYEEHNAAAVALYAFELDNSETFNHLYSSVAESNTAC